MDKNVTEPDGTRTGGDQAQFNVKDRIWKL